MSEVRVHNYSVLVIEDNPGDTNLVREALAVSARSFTHFQITAADSLKSALAQLASHSFDIALVDLNLPDSQGLETFNCLRSSHADLPIIILSGSSLEEGAILAVQKGAQDYIFKEDLQTCRLGLAIHYAIERAQLQQSLRKAQLRAEEISRLKSEFLTMMSHEVRTPMNGVIGMTSLLQQSKLSEEQREFVDTIRTSGEMLLGIINDILDFSKIEAGKFKLEPSQFNLRDLIEETLEVFHGVTQKKGLFLSDVIDPQIPTLVFGDASRVRQILTNLVGNAIKFTQRGEIRVDVTIEEKPGTAIKLRFEISDTGIGLAPEECEQLFQPFTQIKRTSHKKMEGTGLGLSISRRLTEMMGGTIGVESQLNKGSRFWFTILFERWAEQRNPRIDLVSKRVLFIDSGNPGGDTLRRQLSSRGIQYVSCNPKQVALEVEKARRWKIPFDLAIVNAESPKDVQGIDIVSSLRGDSGKAAMPTLFIRTPLRQSQLYGKMAALLGEPVEEEPLPALVPLVARGQRILIADDNSANQKVACRIVQKLGFTYDVVANGNEAVDAVTRVPYALVLMDCEMPELDGYEATRILRATPGAEGLPIIAMTAYAMEEERERCFAAGMSDYVAKPVTIESLSTVLRPWVADAPVAASADPVLATAVKHASPVDPKVLRELKSLCEEGDEKDFLTEILEMFLKSAPELLDRISAIADQDDRRALRPAAHRLKGCCGNVGARNMMQLCEIMENHHRTLSMPEIRSLISGLREEFKEVKDTLDRDWRAVA